MKNIEIRRRKRVFVSHPYKDSPDENKIKAQAICLDIFRNGHIPISPLHLFSFMEDDGAREDIISWCLEMINLCDEVWVFGSSEGCNIERAYAEKKGKTVKIMY